MDDVLELCKTFRKHSNSTIIIRQELSEEDKRSLEFEKPYLRSYEHKFQSNNWLKFHHMPMRRKPFKRGQHLLLDEFHYIHTSRHVSE